MTGQINYQTHVSVNRKYHIAVHLLAFIAVLQITMHVLAIKHIIPPIQIGDLEGYYENALLLRDQASGQMVGGR